jgi:hypothetical protein
LIDPDTSSLQSYRGTQSKEKYSTVKTTSMNGFAATCIVRKFYRDAIHAFTFSGNPSGGNILNHSSAVVLDVTFR